MRKENGKSLTHAFGSKVKHSRILKTVLVLVVSIAKLEHVSAGMEKRVCFIDIILSSISDWRSSAVSIQLSMTGLTYEGKVCCPKK